MQNTYIVSNPSVLASTLKKKFNKRKYKSDQPHSFYKVICEAYNTNTQPLKYLIDKLCEWGDFEDYFLLIEYSYSINYSLYEYLVNIICKLFREQLFIYEKILNGDENYELSDLCDIMPTENKSLDSLTKIVSLICKNIYGSSDFSSMKKYRQALISLRQVKGTLVNKWFSTDEIKTLNLASLSDTCIIDNHYRLKKYESLRTLLHSRLVKAWNTRLNIEKISYMNKYTDTQSDEGIYESWILGKDIEFRQMKITFNKSFVDSLFLIDNSSIKNNLLLCHLVNIILTLFTSGIYDIYMVDQKSEYVNVTTKLQTYNENNLLSPSEIFRSNIEILKVLISENVNKISIPETLLGIKKISDKSVIFISSNKIDHKFNFPDDEFIYWRLINMKFDKYWENNVSGVPFFKKSDNSSYIKFSSLIDKHSEFQLHRVYYPYHFVSVNSKTCDFLNETHDSMIKEISDMKKTLETKDAENKIISNALNKTISSTEYINKLEKKLIHQTKLNDTLSRIESSTKYELLTLTNAVNAITKKMNEQSTLNTLSIEKVETLKNKITEINAVNSSSKHQLFKYLVINTFIMLAYTILLTYSVLSK